MTLRRLLPSSLAALAFLVGCRGEAAAPAVAPDATYTVRAEIVRLPAVPGGDFYLRHESIPGFRNAHGEVVGMMSMTMPFLAAPSLDLAGVAAGDRVEADFEVRWKEPRRPLLVTRLAPLAPGTVLEFDEPADDQTSGETPR